MCGFLTSPRIAIGLAGPLGWKYSSEVGGGGGVSGVQSSNTTTSAAAGLAPELAVNSASETRPIRSMLS